MTRKKSLLELKVRLHKLENNGKNSDSPGVITKLKRKIRRLEEKEKFPL